MNESLITQLKEFVNRVDKRNGWVSANELFVEMITHAQNFLIMYRYDGNDRRPLTPAQSLMMMWNDLKQVAKTAPDLNSPNCSCGDGIIHRANNHIFTKCFPCMRFDSYSKPSRKDGMCKICEVEPNYNRESNKYYCRFCQSEIMKYKNIRKQRSRRKDGICPKCELNPRYRSKNSISVYCKPCNDEYKRAWRSKQKCRKCDNIRALNSDGTYSFHCDECRPIRNHVSDMCSFCVSNPKHITRSGIKITYCLDCHNRKCRENRIKRMEKMSFGS